jgi:hypothetical protein
MTQAVTDTIACSEFTSGGVKVNPKELTESLREALEMRGETLQHVADCRKRGVDARPLLDRLEELANLLPQKAATEPEAVGEVLEELKEVNYELLGCLAREEARRGTGLTSHENRSGVRFRLLELRIRLLRRLRPPR